MYFWLDFYFSELLFWFFCTYSVSPFCGFCIYRLCFFILGFLPFSCSFAGVLCIFYILIPVTFSFCKCLLLVCHASHNIDLCLCWLEIINFDKVKFINFLLWLQSLKNILSFVCNYFYNLKFHIWVLFNLISMFLMYIRFYLYPNLFFPHGFMMSLWYYTKLP